MVQVMFALMIALPGVGAIVGGVLIVWDWVIRLSRGY